MGTVRQGSGSPLHLTGIPASARFPAPAPSTGSAIPAVEDCRNLLVQTIRAETVGIDVGFWFMEDQWYANELIAKWNAGVPVRVIVDSRANATYPQNGPILNLLKNAGIPMRERFTGGILHWKMMLFSGQGIVQFSGANYSPDAWLPLAMPIYSNYVDEAIFFTDKASIVNSFRNEVRRSLAQHHPVPQLRQHRRTTDARTRRLHEGSRAEFRSGRVVLRTVPSSATTPRRRRSTSSCTASPISGTPTRSSQRSTAAFQCGSSPNRSSTAIRRGSGIPGTWTASTWPASRSNTAVTRA